MPRVRQIFIMRTQHQPPCRGDHDREGVGVPSVGVFVSPRVACPRPGVRCQHPPDSA